MATNNPAQEAMRKVFFNSRLRAVIKNEKKEIELSVLEVMVEELEKLTRRTSDFINNSKFTLATREAILKATEGIPVQTANQLMRNLPEFPEKPRPRPKVLDNDLTSYLLYGGYIKPNLEEVTDEDFVARAEAIFDCDPDDSDENPDAEEQEVPDFPAAQTPNFRLEREDEEGNSPWVDLIKCDENMNNEDEIIEEEIRE